MKAIELNFDGIVGPTHNYAGLSWGNVASLKNKLAISNPKQAALEGLAKMKFLMDLGVKQAVLPPHERPHLPTLRTLGYSGSDADVLRAVQHENPTLLAACCSASAMWAANAATVSPSADTSDGRVHFTPANLITQFHRSIEPPTTARIMRTIFADEKHFAHHAPLPATTHFADEGAANHTRLETGRGGKEIFVYGRSGFDSNSIGPTKFPARQTLEASQAIARRHGVSADRTLFLRQNPAAIDAGAFHNDVVCVGHRNVLLIHERAFAEPFALEDSTLSIVTIAENDLSLEDIVATYLFNSQLVTLPDDSIALIAPIECREHPGARRVIDSIIAGDNPIKSVHFVDVRQSMRNGGGPACLRLRVLLTDQELSCVHPGVILTDALYQQLCVWVARHYRDSLQAIDLADPKLLDESRRALDELTKLLALGSVYEFQGAR